VRWTSGIQPSVQRSRDRSALLNVVAPRDVGILKEHPAVVDVDKRCDE
jgi:hypothetical protein